MKLRNISQWASWLDIIKTVAQSNEGTGLRLGYRVLFSRLSPVSLSLCTIVLFMHKNFVSVLIYKLTLLALFLLQTVKGAFFLFPIIAPQLLC